MIRKRQGRAPFLLASLVVTVYVGVVARAQEPNLSPAGEPLVQANTVRPSRMPTRTIFSFTQRMEGHIHTLVGRYKGKIQSWDVVNEAISDRGNVQTAETENLRNSAWLQAIGPEFLTLAFKFAHQADPDATLYYNDYGIEAGPKHESSMVRSCLCRTGELEAPPAFASICGLPERFSPDVGANRHPRPVSQQLRTALPEDEE